DEIFGWLNGAGVTADLRRLAALRQAEFDGYKRGPAPPDRFETWGPPGGDTLSACQPAPTDPTDRTATGNGMGDELVGTGCCAGIVRARVRVVRDPASAVDLPGCILVAERTDPGWTLLFPLAEGLLVQRGSLLSHSAIVAREMGLPCIVG